MKHMIIFVLASVALTGCGINAHDVASTGAAIADATGAKPPVTTAATTIDEKALTITAKTVSTAAITASALSKTCTAVAAYFPACPFLHGTPSAQGIARGLDDARQAVNAAAIARDAGNATTYREALAKAEAAVDAVNDIIKTFGA